MFVTAKLTEEKVFFSLNFLRLIVFVMKCLDSLRFNLHFVRKIVFKINVNSNKKNLIFFN